MLAATCDTVTRPALSADAEALSWLSARVFGPGRFVRSAYRIREGTPVVSPYCRVAEVKGQLIAALRMTEVRIGATRGALLLGPLAVDPDFANQGHGRRLIAESLEAARLAGRTLVLLVGDLPYYGRLGFEPIAMGRITLPGPVDPARLLALELEPGSLSRASGRVVADVDDKNTPQSS
jgi:predicted N-acetyltransferase YhbS